MSSTITRSLPSLLAYALFALSMICGSNAAKSYYVMSKLDLPTLSATGLADASDLQQSVLAGLGKDSHGQLTRRFVEFQAREVQSSRELWVLRTQMYSEFARNQAIGWFAAAVVSLALALASRPGHRSAA